MNWIQAIATGIVFGPLYGWILCESIMSFWRMMDAIPSSEKLYPPINHCGPKVRTYDD